MGSFTYFLLGRFRKLMVSYLDDFDTDGTISYGDLLPRIGHTIVVPIASLNAASVHSLIMRTILGFSRRNS